MQTSLPVLAQGDMAAQEQARRQDVKFGGGAKLFWMGSCRHKTEILTLIQKKLGITLYKSMSEWSAKCLLGDMGIFT